MPRVLNLLFGALRRDPWSLCHYIRVNHLPLNRGHQQVSGFEFTMTVHGDTVRKKDGFLAPCVGGFLALAECSLWCLGLLLALARGVGWKGWEFSLSLSLSLSHTHTHTHTYCGSNLCLFILPSLAVTENEKCQQVQVWTEPCSDVEMLATESSDSLLQMNSLLLFSSFVNKWL